MNKNLLPSISSLLFLLPFNFPFLSSFFLRCIDGSTYEMLEFIFHLFAEPQSASSRRVTARPETHPLSDKSINTGGKRGAGVGGGGVDTQNEDKSPWLGLTPVSFELLLRFLLITQTKVAPSKPSTTSSSLSGNLNHPENTPLARFPQGNGNSSTIPLFSTPTSSMEQLTAQLLSKEAQALTYTIQARTGGHNNTLGGTEGQNNMGSTNTGGLWAFPIVPAYIAHLCGADGNELTTIHPPFVTTTLEALQNHAFLPTSPSSSSSTTSPTSLMGAVSPLLTPLPPGVIQLRNHVIWPMTVETFLSLCLSPNTVSCEGSVIHIGVGTSTQNTGQSSQTPPPRSLCSKTGLRTSLNIFVEDLLGWGTSRGERVQGVGVEGRDTRVVPNPTTLPFNPLPTTGLPLIPSASTTSALVPSLVISNSRSRSHSSNSYSARSRNNNRTISPSGVVLSTGSRETDRGGIIFEEGGTRLVPDVPHLDIYDDPDRDSGGSDDTARTGTSQESLDNPPHNRHARGNRQVDRTNFIPRGSYPGRYSICKRV